MRPTREDACHALSLLRQIPCSLNDKAWPELYGFIMQCTKYLPSKQAVENDRRKRRSGRQPLIKDTDPPSEE